MKYLQVLTTLSIFLLFSFTTHSYVENTIHGYANCMSCHINPTGGGILTDYGRSLSSELMSTWKTKNFQKPFYGLVNNTKTLKWGGHVRTIQTRYENNQIKRGSSFFMQNNVEAAAYIQDFVAVGTVGSQEGPSKRVENKGEFVSERHYLLWNIDQSTRVKAGKFRQAYGINDPNHTRLTKQNLGFGSYSETYQLEVSKFYETGEVILSSSLGRIDLPEATNYEKNFAGQFTHYLQGKSLLSANLLLGESSQTRRALYGINGIIPLLKHNFIRFQWDYQVSESLLATSDGTKDHAILGHLIAGRQFFDGFTGYLVYEQMQSDLVQTRLSLTTSPGVGIQWLPLPHIEFQFEHQYRTAYLTKDNPEHRSFLAFHLYH